MMTVGGSPVSSSLIEALLKVMSDPAAAKAALEQIGDGIKLYEQREADFTAKTAEAQKAAADRDQALTEREKSVAGREAAVESGNRDLNSRIAAADAAERSLKSRTAAVQTREDALVEAQETDARFRASRESEFQAQQQRANTDIATARATLQQAQQAHTGEKQTFAAQSAEQKKALAARAAELDEREAAVAKRESEASSILALYNEKLDALKKMVA